MCYDNVMCSQHETGFFIKRALFLPFLAVLLLRKLLISNNKMKAILFLSFFIFFVDITFSISSGICYCYLIIIYVGVTFVETAETIDTAFQADDDSKTGITGMCGHY